MAEIAINSHSFSPAFQARVWGQPANHFIMLMKSHTSSFHHPRWERSPYLHRSAHRLLLDGSRRSGVQVTPPDWQLWKQMLGFMHPREACFSAATDSSLLAAGGVGTP